MAFIPNHVYILYNKTSGTVLDLSDGGTGNGTQCQGWQDMGDHISTFNQQWFITSVSGLNGVFNLCNLRGGTYLDLSNGSGGNHTKVQGWSKVGGGSAKNQQWKIFTDAKGGYRLQNVAGSTYLDLSNGGNNNGTKVQGYQYVDTSNERWELRRVSRTGSEIHGMVRANPFTPYVQDGLYIVLPGTVRKDIYNGTGLSTTKWRSEIFDCDDFAFVAKAAVAKWGNDNIRADGIAIVFGVMFGRKTSGEAHAYNWYLTPDLSSIIFFEPQHGNEMVDSGYPAYFGVF